MKVATTTQQTYYTLEINSTLVRRTLCYASQVWAPQSIISIIRIERIQRRATKFILDLPFFGDISYNQRLEMLNLLPVCYWHEYLDMVFFFNGGMVNIDIKVLPELRSRARTTRSTDTKCLTFTTRQCKTSTSQKSFVTRSTRVWNILPKKLTEKNTTFSSFKNGLYENYKSALSNYDAEDPRTWKSICLSCNMCRNLSCPILCFFSC